MVEKNIHSLAKLLNDARLAASPVGQISKDHSDLTRMDAYSIQEEQMLLRQDMDEKIAGWKMGLTSEAKRRQMNLDSPLYGFLTDKMQVKNGDEFSLTGTIHPKIEPEIAFRISKDLEGKVTREQVLEACSGIAACMEILDSRYTEFKYFSMEDVIADNSSSSHFVVGEWVSDFKKIDLLNLKMQMFVDDAVSATGVSSDISGDPVQSVIELCGMLESRGKILRAGSIVLAGAATPAITLKPNMQIELRVDQLNPVNVVIVTHK
ncbi:MAG: fumarylacetoacetate hydrolase family protein [Bacteriovorax sp.]